MREESGKQQGRGMSKREGNRFIRSLLAAGILFLLLFIVLSVASWNRYFCIKPGQWREWKGMEEPYELQEKKSLLFLSSYDPSDLIFPQQMEGIEEILNQSNVHLDIVNMDFRHFNHEEDVEAFYAFVKSRIENRESSYDGILVGDDRALNFIMEYKKELFPNLPVVFFSIGSKTLAEKAGEDSGMTGYYCPSFLEETLETATALQPKAETIMAIYDNSYSGIAAREDFFSLQRQFSSYRFAGINFSQLKREEFVQALKAIQDKTILVFLSAYQDGDGNNYPESQMVKLILNTVDTPVYGNSMVRNIPGFIGGRVQDYRQMAKDATLLMLDILSSKVKIEERSCKMDSPGQMVINNRVLLAYGLSKSHLSNDVFLEDSIGHFLAKYVGYFLLSLLPILAILLFFVYSLLGKLHSTKLLEELEKKNENLLMVRDELEHKLSYDHLTELLNRQTILASIEELLKNSEEFTCVLMDIDNLKELNESRGYETGDLYLSAVANRLRKMEKAHGAVASRYGGDEFLIVFPGVILPEDSQALQELHSIFRRSITVGGETVNMNSSGGVATSNGKDSPKQIVVSAGIAMSSAKKKGKNRLVYYTDELRYKKEKINLILKKVEKAIEENAFYMVYQPQIDCKTKKIVGFESLMRIHNDACYPDQFIPVAEQYGFITKLGKIAVEQVIRQLARWREEGKELRPISINFSSYQIYDDDFIEFLLYQLNRFAIPHEYVVLEITESILFEESKQTKSVFKKLVEAGIQLHLDDFGTGYSSFSYLPYIPLNTVKMDKSIIDNFLLNNGDVVRNLISIIHDLGKVVIVEGVEEEWQYEKLLDYNCDMIQGYLFGGPLQAGEVHGVEVHTASAASGELR